MQEEIRKAIKQDVQIKKFGFYGFLKNLRFFEPYLIIYLMSHQISLFQIGILIAIRELIVNVFEIPSGFIADYFGRKKELYLCFLFYILSFVAFFLTNNFIIAAIGMALFGLGEVFRSGTHKAMIYTYLDHKNWQKEKAFVYGRTRSCSLMGSALSSVLGIVLILLAPNDSYIFLFSVVPYVLDTLLIISYPQFLDGADKNAEISLQQMVKDLAHNFRINANLRHFIVEEGMAEASYSYAKDLIQPILEMIIVGSGVVVIANISSEDNLKIILGVVYAVLNLFGSYFSKRAYLVKGNNSSIQCLSVIHVLYAVVFAMLGIFSHQYVVVCLLYLLVYIMHSVRKPLFIDEIDNHMDKSNRATVLSTTAQLKSIFLMVVAPILGLIADWFSIGTAVLALGFVFACTIGLLKTNNPSQNV